MNGESKRSIEERVISAAEAALAEQKFVSAIDVLMRMGWLAAAHFEDWRKGRLLHLEESLIQIRPEKIGRALAAFHEWAKRQGLKPTDAPYLASGRGPRSELQFSISGDAEAERAYKIRYVSPELSEKKQEKLREKLGAAPDLVVFSILRDSTCSECQAELWEDSHLFMENGQPLCLACADLDHLVYLPRGDAALTRRAKKYSSLSAVVVRFSRARGRYERQGLLVEEAALERAEEECLSDMDLRAARRERDALRRTEEDQELVAEMTTAIRRLFPGCPPEEARKIAAHAAVRGSGRVGRSAAGRALEETALTAAVIASIRHKHTNYDELLMKTGDRVFAREKVRDEIERILDKWREGESAIAS